MGEKSDGFLEHGFAEGVKRGEMALAFFRKCCEVADVKPLAAELGRESTDAGVTQHATDLRAKGVCVRQSAGSGEREQLFIGG